MSVIDTQRELNHNIAVAHPGSLSVPHLPKNGAVVKLCYAGAVVMEGSRRPLRPSVFGFEIAGVLQNMSSDIPNSNYQIGDNVIVFPNYAGQNEGLTDYIAIDNVERLVQIPKSIALEVASMLPGAALTAYSAVKKAKYHVDYTLQRKQQVNVLVIGAGGQGLWTLQVVHWFMNSVDKDKLNLSIADDSIDRLLCARDHGCLEVIHWNEEDHEEYIIERTKDAYRSGGPDVIIDYVGSSRTMKRSLSVLNHGGLILVGGESLSFVNLSLQFLRSQQPTITSIPRGSYEELTELVSAVANKKLQPPKYSVYKADQASTVYNDLSESKIVGPAVLCFHNPADSLSTSKTTDN